MHHRNRFRGGETHDHPADQAGACGRGHRRKLRKANARLFHRPVNDPVKQIDMGARRDLRHDAAEGGVLLGLRAHDIG